MSTPDGKQITLKCIKQVFFNGEGWDDNSSMSIINGLTVEDIMCFMGKIPLGMWPDDKEEFEAMRKYYHSRGATR